MANEPQYTPEQIQAMKQANAHGFVDFLTVHGIPKLNAQGAQEKSASGTPITTPVTPEEAVGLYQKAAAFNAAVQGQVEQVKTTIREHVKAAAAPAAAA